MDAAAPFAIVANDLRERFIKLLDSLSTVRALTSLDVHHQDEVSLLDSALKVLVQHQNLERCSAFLLKGDTLVCVAGKNYLTSFQERERDEVSGTTSLPDAARLGEGLIGLAAKTKELQNCMDCSNDPRLPPVGDGAVEMRGSLMCAPVMNGDEVLGVITLSHDEPDFFQDWHRYVLVVFCNILGHMLANSRTMRHLEEMVEQRTRQLGNALAEAERLKRQFEELSVTDELTRLHNRRFFYSQAEAALSNCIRHQQPYCVMLLDIDFFKKINDTYGHAAGDMTLVGLAKALQQRLRGGDLLARYGGEEFVLALPMTPLEGAMTVAARIREHVNKLEWKTDAQTFRITVSIGIAEADAHERSRSAQVLEDLLKQADEALYYSKENGRDQANVYSQLPRSQQTATGD